ncbi:hypothetical protein D2E90_20815 [Mycobacteroides abscessus]|nr:hypothetical protein D2E90_20815 [Mycobacteroides abscessus]
MNDNPNTNGDNMKPRIEPQVVIDLVEQYIDKELRHAEQYINRAPFDDSGCWSLHRLAADIYAQGYGDGERAQAERGRREALRQREAREKASE